GRVRRGPAQRPQPRGPRARRAGGPGDGRRLRGGVRGHDVGRGARGRHPGPARHLPGPARAALAREGPARRGPDGDPGPGRGGGAGVLRLLGRAPPDWLGAVVGRTRASNFGVRGGAGAGASSYYWFVTLPVITLEAYAWGLLGSALTRHVLPGAGLGILIGAP